MESRERAYHLFTIPAISSKMPTDLQQKAECRIQFYWSGLIARKKVSQSDSRRPKLPNPRKGSKITSSRLFLFQAFLSCQQSRQRITTRHHRCWRCPTWTASRVAAEPSNCQGEFHRRLQPALLHMTTNSQGRGTALLLLISQV
jgi:hypothetical protein